MCQLSVHVCVTVFVYSNFLSQMDTLLSCSPSLSAELRSTGTAQHFAYLLNTSDYRILRMDEDHDRMYVGSKDYILSLDLHDINKEPLIVRDALSHH